MNLIGWIISLPIRFYRYFLSPLLPASCRFYPTCSAYGLEAIKSYGPFRGGWMTVRRIGRCNPFHPGGYDPVPLIDLNNLELNNVEEE